MKLLNIIILCALSISSISASEKIYIDDDSLEHKQDCFHIHQGHNLWLETRTVHRDSRGLFTFEGSLLRSKSLKSEYKKTWKCPYCYQYWPIGTACQNQDCPSKYKFQ
jgi:hypothetical protein